MKALVPLVGSLVLVGLLSSSCGGDATPIATAGASAGCKEPTDGGKLVAPSESSDASATTAAEASDAATRSSDAAASAHCGDARAPSTSSDASADAVSPPPPPVFDCELYLEVDQLKPATCAVVDPVSHRVGRLRWICAGGPARLTLGDVVLEGSVQGDVVELSTCREDPVSWLSGHYETVSISADLGAKRGALSFARASGLSCPHVFTDCSATAGVSLYP